MARLVELSWVKVSLKGLSEAIMAVWMNEGMKDGEDGLDRTQEIMPLLRILYL